MTAEWCAVSFWRLKFHIESMFYSKERCEHFAFSNQISIPRYARQRNTLLIHMIYIKTELTPIIESSNTYKVLLNHVPGRFERPAYHIRSTCIHIWGSENNKVNQYSVWIFKANQYPTTKYLFNWAILNRSKYLKQLYNHCITFRKFKCI